jgi:hypothetical protein
MSAPDIDPGDDTRGGEAIAIIADQSDLGGQFH